MELIIKDQGALQPIEFNFEELKQELAGRLQHYNSLTYTEEEVKTAKSDRATLNKFKDAIETRRKEIKTQCLKPYEDFEKKVKEIVKMIDQPILAIDGQIKKFEEKTKEEKRQGIQAFYAGAIGDLAELLPLSKIWNEKWLNATTNIKTVQDEIMETIARVDSDLKVINDLKSEFEFQIKDVYLRTLNLSAAIQEKTRLEDQKAKQEAYAKVQAEKQTQQTVITVEREPEGNLTQESQEKIEEIVMQPPQVMQIDFRVWATKDQLEALKQFLLQNGIKYGKVS